MNAAFKVSICEPLSPTTIEKGVVAPREIISQLEAFPWEEYLAALAEAEEQGKEVYYSPSFEVEQESAQQAIVVSAVGVPNDFEFYIFIKDQQQQIQSK